MNHVPNARATDFFNSLLEENVIKALRTVVADEFGFAAPAGYDHFDTSILCTADRIVASVGPSIRHDRLTFTFTGYLECASSHADLLL
ncbi:MAG: hypothetical protein K0S66_2475 [Sphingomonas sp.]|nr:hypothetical protein [Sphingomonas sp.]